jgi:hypothetical protein
VRENRAKLPKWAQALLQAREADVRYWKDIAMKATEGKTRVFFQEYDDNLEKETRHLPDDRDITFEIGPRAKIDVRIDRDHYGRPALMVMGSNSISVEPSSSNVVYLRIRE